MVPGGFGPQLASEASGLGQGGAATSSNLLTATVSSTESHDFYTLAKVEVMGGRSGLHCTAL
ncbi:MAG: hypothetical protein ACI8X5_001926 [Planctomycetota bacterium]|jgi:hypothetical protein